MMPERLSDYSLQPVSASRKPTVLLADRETESRFGGAIWSIENGEHFVAAALGTLKDASEGGLLDKPASTIEVAVPAGVGCCVIFRSVCGRCWHALRRQPRPAFGASALYHQAAALRCHSRSESMGASPLEYTGLKCSFHLGATWLNSGCARVKR